MINKFVYIGFTVILILIVYFTYNVGDSDYEEVIKQNQELRKQLELSATQVENLRMKHASERQELYKQIQSIEENYNKLQAQQKANEEKYKGEIDRLKKSTIKDLEDEAERIYSAGCKH